MSGLDYGNAGFSDRILMNGFREDLMSRMVEIRNGEARMNFGLDDPKKTAPEKPPITWDDVVGLDDAKTQLQEAIEAPFLHKEVYEAFHISPPKGVLLYGPPGCGKTMLGRAASCAMAKVHNKKVFDGFFYYNGAEMFGPHVGCEEKWIRDAFEKADNFYKEHGYPAILFFDEADSMLPRREISPPWTRNAVNQFLSIMDGLKQCTAFVLLATDNHLILDEAAIRPGRIDRKIFVGPPSKESVRKILDLAFAKKPTKEPLVDFIMDEFFNEARFIGERQFSEFINGASAAALADRAGSIAFNRALRDAIKTKNDLVITKDDALAAINILFGEIMEFSKALANLPSPKFELSVNHKIQNDGTSEDIF